MDEKFRYENWKRTEKMKKHSTSHKHMLAMAKWSDYEVSRKKQNSVVTQLVSHHAEQVAENRKYLRMLIETVAFLAQQNIAFRGHFESTDDVNESSDINRGNFLELLSLRAKDSTFLREKLEKMKTSKTPQYLHKDHQK